MDELGRGKASNGENTTLFLKNYLYHALEIHLQFILHCARDQLEHAAFTMTDWVAKMEVTKSGRQTLGKLLSQRKVQAQEELWV